MTNSLNKLCRACLTTKESFAYVLNENVSVEVYYFCTSVEVQQDEFPRTLCSSCYELLTKYSEFKRTCIQSQNTLLSLKFNGRDENEVFRTESDFLGALDAHENLIQVKTEEACDNSIDAQPMKAENLSDQYNDDMFEGVDLCDNTEPVIQSKLQKRRTRKLGKIKPKSQTKVKLKGPKKHFTFTCDVCNKKFNYLQRFEAHKLEHEGKVAIIHCLPCNKTFMTWSGLRRHNDSEHTLVSLEKLKCNICGMICKSQQTLKMHNKTHGERKMYVCDVCGKGCTTKFILKSHLETHKENRDRLFTCEHCGKKFYTNTILLSHVSRRHTGRRFICQICSYPFTDKYNLTKHLLIHDGKKLYKCEICEKSYSKQASLVEHKRIHSGERPFLCSYCPKSFLSKRRLDDHHRVHTGERPYKCLICEQGFTQRGTLKRHMKVHKI